MTKVKICGLSTPEAEATAVKAGADYIGFVFAKSKRQVSLEQAHELAKGVTGQTKIVGVFVSPSLEELEEAGNSSDTFETKHYCVSGSRDAVLSYLRSGSFERILVDNVRFSRL